jgi:hypothetical protein
VLLVCLLCLSGEAMAQIKVELSIKRRLFLVYEPIIATVAVTNLAGRDIVLEDKGVHRWFGFTIVTGEGGIVSPINVNYGIDPLLIPAGATVRRSVNLTPLYAIRSPGLYRIRAAIYGAEFDKYFPSPTDNIQVVQGHVLWQQNVGVPEGEEGAGEMRTVKLLNHRGAKQNTLYVQVENSDQGIVYGIYKLGRLLRAQEPQILLDSQNNIHILQVNAPKAYLYSKVSPNGEWLGQTSYLGTKSRPSLSRLPDGQVAIRGGKPDVPAQLPPGMTEAPKLSDRPAGIPQ